MTVTSVILVASAFLLAGLFLNPRLLRLQHWQAIVTPLASIIGSGFLVAGPILAGVAGKQAWMAMAGLCAVGYLFGAVIRHNIAHVEPMLSGDTPSRSVVGLERLSDLALSFAYFVSVAYYIHLFAAFGLRLGNITDLTVIRIVATLVIGCIGALGFLGGLAALERLAVGVVGLKLSLIGAVLAGLVFMSVNDIVAGEFRWPVLHHPAGFQQFSILLGLIILVQGFETSRYLGDAYDRPTRIATMRQAQWIATAIYLAFIVLITRYFSDTSPSSESETAIVDMLRPLGQVVAPIIILAALASQLSAAVADTNGAGGLLSESLKGRLSVNLGNLITAMMAIAIIWSANIYAIIAYASKAFVLYYALQSIQATRSAWLQGQRVRALLFLSGAMLALAVIVLAIPADA